MPELNAQTIRGLRVSLGLTQEAFAQHLGVSVSSVRDWEQDRRKPRGLYAKLITQEMAASTNALGVDGSKPVAQREGITGAHPVIGQESDPPKQAAA